MTSHRFGTKLVVPRVREHVEALLSTRDALGPVDLFRGRQSSGMSPEVSERIVCPGGQVGDELLRLVGMVGVRHHSDAVGPDEEVRVMPAGVGMPWYPS